MAKNGHVHEGGLVGRSNATPTIFFSVDSYDLKSMSFKFGNNIFLTFEMPGSSYSWQSQHFIAILSICNQRSLGKYFSRKGFRDENTIKNLEFFYINTNIFCPKKRCPTFFVTPAPWFAQHRQAAMC